MACFGVWTLQSDSRYGAPCSRVSVTPVASPTPTPAQAQRAADQASSGGTCCKFFSAHASSTWRIARQRGLPRYHRLKEYGTGAAQVGGLERLADAASGAPWSRWAESNCAENFADRADAKLFFGTEIVCNPSTGLTCWHWGLWSVVMLN